jgi:hypothetical protein
LPRGLGAIGGSPRAISPRRPTDRIAESFGTTRNPDPFLLTEAQINAAKGSLFALEVPLLLDTIEHRARIAATNVETAQQIQDSVNEMFAPVRAVRVINPPLSSPY